MQALGLPADQGEGIEPGQLTVIGRSASRPPTTATLASSSVTDNVDNIEPAAKAITRQAAPHHEDRTWFSPASLGATPGLASQRSRSHRTP
jgi:hypothetical protein